MEMARDKVIQIQTGVLNFAHIGQYMWKAGTEDCSQS